jgi:hypothetical protein
VPAQLEISNSIINAEHVLTVLPQTMLKQIVYVIMGKLMILIQILAQQDVHQIKYYIIANVYVMDM